MTRMFSRVRIAIRFFFMGLAVGILLAPRSGAETRQLVRAKADQLLNDVLDAATLGTVDDGSARAAAGTATAADDTSDDGEAAPRSRNGRTRSRAASAAQA
jgi:gas vesicle protein